MNFNLKGLIERDQTILELENNVFSKIKEMTKDDILNFNKKTLNFVSVEDAIKELLNLQKI